MHTHTSDRTLKLSRVCLVLSAWQLLDCRGPDPSITSFTQQLVACAAPDEVIVMTALKVRVSGQPTATSFPFVLATPLTVCVEIRSGGKPGGAGGSNPTAAVTL